MYADELRHFLRCLDGIEEPQLDVEGGASVLEVALAARKSAEAGITVPLERVRERI
jgi:predicted dehydrogenase